MDRDDYLPISMLNAFEYCPRRFYYEHVLGEMIVNEHVLEGSLQHEVADSGERSWEEEGLVLRRVYIFSDELRVSGFIDVLEVSSAGDRLTPIEYKKGKMGRWLNDHIQLCAQALCLEEHTGRGIEEGVIFYFGSRRRQRVLLDQALREKTREAVAAARDLRRSGSIPPPLTKLAKCRDCSLEPLCLPREVRLLNSSSQITT